MMKSVRNLLASPVIAIGVITTAVLGAQGTVYTWTGAGTPNEDGSLNWSDSANWNATAPAYPGKDARGVASTVDTATFPAGTAARVRFDVTTKIATLTAKDAGIDLTFDSPAGNTLTLTGSLVLGDSNSTGVSGSRVTLDGARIITGAGMTLQSGAALFLENAADLKVTTLYIYSSGDYQEGLIDLSGRSVLTMSQLDIGGGGKLVIDDSTVTNTARVYLNEGYHGGGRIVFKGAHPLWVAKGTDFRSANTATYVNGTDLDFLLPEGGYAEPPLQYVHATGRFLFGAGNVKVPMRLNLLAESPAITAGDTLDQTLVTTVAGIYTDGLALNGTMLGGAVTVGYNDAKTAVISHISSPAKTLDVESVSAFASGANIANVHREDVAEGEKVVFRARPVVTPNGTATPTGIRVFDVDPDTLVRTEIEGSPFAGSEVAYVHGTTRRAVVWQWSWEGEGDIFVSPSVGSDENGGTSWNDTYKTVEKAFEGLADGKTIVLDAGRYPIAAPLSLTVGATVKGMGMHETSIMPSDPASFKTRVLYINHPDAAVSGLTITGGRPGSRYQYGCGVWIDTAGGTVSNCFISGNSACERYQYGGGVGMTGDKALLTHCIVCSNKVAYAGDSSYGGGICMSAGTVDTCLVFDNSSCYGGGGLAFYSYKTSPYGSVLRVLNSTFTRNTASSYGGGVYFEEKSMIAEVRNCIFSGNVAPNDMLLGAPEWSPAYSADAAKLADNYKNVSNQVFTCAFYAANPVGEGSVAVDQPFADSGSYDFHLLPGNGAVDAGTWYEGIAGDLDGKPRDETPDIGCYELDKSNFTCSFAISPEVAFNDVPIGFTPTVQNPPENITYTWTLTDRFGAKTVLTEVAPTQAIAKCGWYGVKLRVEEVGKPSNAAEFEVGEALHIAPHDLYAVGGGANPTMAYPFDSEEKGHTNLVELAEEMIDGSRVHLGEGEFIVTDEFAVTVAATVTGAGMDRTVIRYVRPEGSNGTRPLHINHPQAVVERMTLTGGDIGVVYNQWGTGVLIDARGGTLRDCRVTGNKSSTYHTLGAVAIRSTSGYASRCVIDNNSSKTGTAYGGGLTLSDGYVDNCLVVSNTANLGGGIYMSASQHAEVRNCTVVDNFSSGTGDDSVYPGGLYMVNCGEDVRVVNCIFFRNQPGVNATTDTCCGYPECHVKTGEVKPLDSDYVKARLLNCLMDVDLEAQGATSLGKDGVTGDPKFVNAAAWDFRLDRESPCVNAGDNRDYTAASVDFYGKPRVFNFGKRSGIVDIGCSESPWGTKGLCIIVR